MWMRSYGDFIWEPSKSQPRGGTVAEDLLSQIRRELDREQAKINATRHGKIVLYVQDGKLVRWELTESKKPA